MVLEVSRTHLNASIIWFLFILVKQSLSFGFSRSPPAFLQEIQSQTMNSYWQQQILIAHILHACKTGGIIPPRVLYMRKRQVYSSMTSAHSRHRFLMSFVVLSEILINICCLYAFLCLFENEKSYSDFYVDKSPWSKYTNIEASIIMMFFHIYEAKIFAES